jgi:hypothetical protein
VTLHRSKRRRIQKNQNKSRFPKTRLYLEPLEDRTLMSTSPAPALFEPTRIIVRFDSGVSPTQMQSIVPGAVFENELNIVPGTRVVNLPAGINVENALDRFRASNFVRYAEPSYYRTLQQTFPNDPQFSGLYGLHNTGQGGGVADSDIDAPEAWDLTTGSSSFIVAVFDTGIDFNHPDLAANVWVNPGEIPGNSIDDDGNGLVDDIRGWNWNFNNNNVTDTNGHGTHVSGTIGAVGNNAVGVAGVNWNVKIMMMKIFEGSSGYAGDAAVVSAINYVINKGVKVSNHSWGGGPFSQVLLDGITAARNAGHLFIAAAGNFSSNNDASPFYPASYNLDNIISVAASTNTDGRASFSSWGLTSVDLAAPGDNVLSTWPTALITSGYNTISGTSMSTPHVVGVAALAWSFSPSSSYQQIRQAIFAGVDPNNAFRTDGPNPVATGGRLNALKTLQQLGLSVTGSSPASGEVVATPPTSFTVNFSHPVDPASVQADDLKVNGISATDVTLGTGDTSATFTYDTSPVTVEGPQTISIAADAITRVSDNDGNDPFTSTFLLDLLRMQVVSTTPAVDSVVALPLTTIDVNLNEAVLPGSVAASDLALSQGTVTGATVLAGDTTIRFTISGLAGEGTFTASIAAGAFTDAVGGPNLAFTGSYAKDLGVVPFDGPLNLRLPLGSLVYAAAGSTSTGPAASHVYDLNGTFADALGGPALVPNGGTLGATGYTFAAGQGPSLSNAINPTTYSIEMVFRIDDTSSFRRLIDFKNGALDEGLYNYNTAVRFYDVAIGPNGAFANGQIRHLVVTRNGANNQFVAYIDGVQQLSFTDSGNLATFDAANNIIRFLRDDGSEHPSGFLDRIRTYSTVLSAAEVLGLFNEGVAPNPNFAAILPETDTDSFTLTVEAAQTISVVLDPAVSLQGTIELFGPSGASLGVATSSAPGADALLQTVATESDTGLYRIEVRGENGTTGSYSLQVILNAHEEAENHGGANNDPVQVLDNRDAGFSATGGFTSYPGQGFRNDVTFAAAGTGSETATWTFAGLTPGSYRVRVTWSTHPNRATDAPFTVLDGATPQGTVLLNQELAPDDFSDQGVAWEDLGTFVITGSELVVQLSDLADEYVIADAVRIEPVAFAAAENLDASFVSLGGSASRGAVLGRTDLVASPLPTEVESNNTLATANNAAGNFNSLTSELYHLGLKGTVGASGDFDFYSIGDLQLGDLITITLSGSASARGTNTNPLLQLLRGAAETPVLVTSDNDSGPGADALIFRFAITTADTYYIRASSSSTETGTYDLGIVLENSGLAPTTGGTVTGETEPNNTAATATDASTSWRVTQYVSVTGAAITPAGDIDFSQYFFNAGDLVTIVIDSSSAADGRINLRNAAGTIIASDDGLSTGTGVDSIIASFIIPSTGTYYIDALATGGTTGAYDLVVYLSANIAPPAVSTGVDNYSFTLDAGDTATIALKSLPSGTVNFRLFDPAGVEVAQGILGGATNVDRVVRDFVAGSTGAYRVEVSSPASLTNYDLVVTRNATFEIEPNNTTAQASAVQSKVVAGEQYVLGYKETGNVFDIYRVNLNAGTAVVLQTFTPAGGAGEFVNTFNPRLRFLSSAGVQLAVDDNSAPDGRNAQLSFVIVTTGTYFIEVSSTPAQATVGEYILQIRSNVITPPAFAISTSVPANGASFLTAPTTYTATFNDNILLTSVDATDLRVDGIDATAVEIIGGDTLRFTLPTGFGPGTHTVTMAAGSIQDVQGTLLTAFSRTFIVDVTPPRVTAMSVAFDSVIAPGNLTLTITFNEAMRIANLDATDIVLLGVHRNVSYTSATRSFNAAGTILTVTFNSLPDDAYRLTLLSADGRFEDAVGHDLDGETAGTLPSGEGTAGGDFVWNFSVDITAFGPFPTLQPKQPLGSLVYTGELTNVISPAGDFEAYTLALDAGHKLSLLVDPGAGLVPAVAIFFNDTLILYQEATAAGADLVVQDFSIDEAGTYLIAVGGVGGAGAYRLQAALNASLENEGAGGPSNNTIDTAQNIDGSLLALGGSASRGAVLGTTDVVAALLPAETEPNNTQLLANNAVGNFSSFTSDYYHLAARGNISATTDVDFFNIGELQAGDIVTITLSGLASARGTNNNLQLQLLRGSAVSPFDVFSDTDSGPGLDALIFRFAITADDTYYIRASATVTGTYELGIGLEDIGTKPNTGGAASQETESNDTAATANDVSSNWQPFQYLSQTSAAITPSGDNDFYQYFFNAGDVITVIIDSTSTADMRVSLRNAASTILATEDGTSGFAGADSLLVSYVIPTTGIYALQVFAAGTGAYSTNVYLSSNIAPPAPTLGADFYSFSLSAGESASLSLKALVDAAAGMTLFDADGTTLALDQAGPNNVDRVINNFVAPTTGTYYVRVRGAQFGIDYNLVVTKNAAFNLEPNNTSATAQDITGREGALGHVNPALGLGRLFAFDQTANLIREVNPTTGAIIRNLTSPISSFAGDYGLATTTTSVLIGGSSTNGIVELNPDTGATIRTIPNPASVFVSGLAFLNNEIFVLTDDFSGRIYVLNYTTGALVRTINTSPAFINEGLTASATQLLGTDGSGNVFQINPLTGATTSLGVFAGSGFPEGLGVVANEIFIADFSVIRVYNLTTLALVRTLSGFNDLEALGADGGVVSEEDWYSVNVSAGDTLVLRTSTPSDGPDQFANLVNPRLEMFDPMGELVGTSAILPDGRNEEITFTALVDGIYLVRVSAEGTAAGEYFLAVGGATGAQPAFQVSSTDPADGASVLSISTYSVTFNDAILLTSVEASDLKVNGMDATAVEIIDGGTLRFTLPAGLPEGTYTVGIGGGAILDVQGTPLTEYAGTFKLDLTAPRIVASAIQENDVLPTGALSIVVHFDEPMLVANLDATDFTLRGNLRAINYAPAGFSYDLTGTILTLNYANLPEDRYTLTLLSATGRFEDRIGHDLDGEANFPIPPNQSGNGVAGGNFVVNFTIDDPVTELTVFQRREPLGSLAYAAGTPLVASHIYELNGDFADALGGPALVPNGGTIEATGYTFAAGQGPSLSNALANPATYSIEMLFSIDETTSFRKLIDFKDRGTDEGIYNFDTALRFYNVATGPSGAIVAGQPRHLVITRDGATNQFVGYINGVQQFAFTDTGSLGIFSTPGSNVIHFLRDDSGGSEQSGGFLDRVRIYDSALGAAQVQGLFNSSSLFVEGLTAAITPAADTDSFTVQLEPGNTVTVVFDPSTTLRGAIELFGPGGESLGIATSAANGADAVLQTIPTLAGPGLYRIEARGVSATTGAYSLFVILNAAEELESHNGPTNNTIATAQDLSNSFLALTSDVSRGAVSGRADGAPFDHYSFTLEAGESATLAAAGPVTLELLDSAGALQARGRGAAHLSQVISNFVAATAGTYFARISGTLNNIYNLVITRNADFDTEPNGSTLLAQHLVRSPSVAQSALGYLTGQSEGDFFQVNAAEGQTLLVRTTTPGGSANTLDPAIRVYGPDGTLVAADDNSGGDLRNAQLSYLVPVSGIHFVEVLSANGAPGEYVVIVESATADLPAFEVSVSNPADGARFFNAPTTTDVTFNDNVLISSLQAADLTFGPLTATAFTVLSGNQVRFTVPGGLGEGAYLVTIADGAILDVQGTPLTEFNAQVFVDRTGPRVIFSSIQEGETHGAGNLSYVVQFDDLLPQSNFDASDFALQGLGLVRSYAPASFDYVAADSILTLNFSNLPEDSYRLTLLSGNGRLEDLAGNDLDGEPPPGLWQIPPQQSGNGVAGGDFVVNFTLDVVSAPFPTTLTAVNPLGGLIYQGQTANPSVISSASDTDAFTINLDAGQTLGVLVTPTGSTLQPVVELLDPNDAVIGSGAASSAGGKVLLQTVAAAAAGTYKIVVSGAGGTTGAFHVQLLLNAAFENESQGGAGNNARAEAQDLVPTFTPLLRNATRGAVVGSFVGIPEAGDYYSFTLDAADTVTVALTRLTGAANLAMTLEDADGATLATAVPVNTNIGWVITNFPAAAAGTYYVRIAGAIGADYSLVVTRNAGFETNPNNTFATAQDITGTVGALGHLRKTIRVAVHGVDSTATSVVNQLRNSTAFNFTVTLVPDSGLDSAAELAAYDVVVLGQYDYAISPATAAALRAWNQAGLGGVVGVGWLFYNINNTSSSTVRADIDAIVPLNMASSSSYTTTSSVTITNSSHPVTQAVSSFLHGSGNGDGSTAGADTGATVLASDSGLPTVIVGPAGSRSVWLSPAYFWTDSSLITGNADRLLEQAVFWAASSGVVTDEDWYRVTAVAGQELFFITISPGVGNTVNVGLALYDPEGNLIATGTPEADGRNESITYVVPEGAEGIYRIRVYSEDGSGGDYFLDPVDLSADQAADSTRMDVSADLNAAVADDSLDALLVTAEDESGGFERSTDNGVAYEFDATAPSDGIVEEESDNQRALDAVFAAEGEAAGLDDELLLLVPLGNE